MIKNTSKTYKLKFQKSSLLYIFIVNFYLRIIWINVTGLNLDFLDKVLAFPQAFLGTFNNLLKFIDHFSGG